ncbi:type III pantothenate kinase [Emticicia sp. SJ17W-69]|uniref:type III pantothenate kinase n=1 Tax=Emticicia sp. SJ17W-69 TaxID=3421657 RepID=UPI003EB7FE90
MNATIDIGNTFAKIGFFDGNDLLEIKKGLSIDELRTALSLKNVKNLIISSVTRSQTELEDLFKQDDFKKVFLNPNTPLPIRKDYETPETLGSDRIAGAVGANYLFPNQNVLIIDMGTAIKYDYISADAAFRGGIISPGMRIRFEALHTFTKRLPLVEANEIPNLIGKSTISCIQSGVVNGIIAEVNGMIENYRKLGNIQVILCGGDAPFFESQIKKPTFALSNLVLIGLNRILQYNV